MSRWALAPAKVNLFLHVGPRGGDGYHPIASLVVFADVGDRLRVQAGGAGLSVRGPFAEHAPAGEENLVLQAARAVGSKASLALEKNIPAGAGLGGGSADAAAAMRLLGGVEELHALAAKLGSDVPACLISRPALGEGRGERLTPWPGLPPLPAVLVWPGEGVSTVEVYRMYSPTSPLRGGRGAAEGGGAGGGMFRPRRCGGEFPPPLPLPSRGRGVVPLGEFVEFLAGCRNDLEAPAITFQPLIGAVLQALRSQPEPILARMTGSGSGCFALCRTHAEAKALAERVAGRYPAWWVRACRLGAPPLWESDE